MSAPQIQYPPTSGGGTPTGGSGTPDTIPRWAGPSTLGDSLLSQSGAIVTNSGTFRTADGSNTEPGYTFTGSSGSGMYRGASGTVLRFASSGTFAFGVSTSQNVLIGGSATSTPARKLTVENNQPLRLGTATEYWDFLQNTTNVWGWLSNAGQYSILMNNTNGNVAVGRVPTAGTIFETQGDQVTFRDAAGNVRFRFEAANSLLNIGIGSGWGLKLPATPGNADTQTLDAYQEIGTGTPAEIALTLTCGTSGTITVNAASSKARVTRVGNKVIGHGRIVVSSVSAPLGRLSCVLTGCPQPFTNFLVETQTDNTTGLASGNRIVGTSDTGATPTIYFDRYAPNTSFTDAAANIQAGTIIYFNICYSV
jgi:hypothetical protein